MAEYLSAGPWPIDAASPVDADPHALPPTPSCAVHVMLYCWLMPVEPPLNRRLPFPFSFLSRLCVHPRQLASRSIYPPCAHLPGMSLLLRMSCTCPPNSRGFRQHFCCCFVSPHRSPAPPCLPPSPRHHVPCVPPCLKAFFYLVLLSCFLHMPCSARAPGQPLMMHRLPGLRAAPACTAKNGRSPHHVPPARLPPFSPATLSSPYLSC